MADVIVSKLVQMIDDDLQRVNVSLADHFLHVNALTVGTFGGSTANLTYTLLNDLITLESGGPYEPANANIQSHISSTENPHSVTATQVGLGNLTNDKQVKGLASGTTAGNFVAFGADGYTVADSGKTTSDFAAASHNHDSVYFTETELGATTSTPGAGLIGTKAAQSWAVITPATDDVMAVLVALDTAVSNANALSNNFDWQPSVKDRLATPPGSPADEDRYLVIATATGAWEGQENKIAQWDATAEEWVFTAPALAMAVMVDDEISENAIYVYGGSSWAAKYFESTLADETTLTKSTFTLSIKSGGVGESQLASSAVTEGKIGSGAVTNAKLAVDAVRNVVIPLTNANAGTLAAGTVVRISAAGSFDKASQNSEAAADGMIGILLAETATTATGNVLIAGRATVLNGSFTGSEKVYLSATAGEATVTCPDTAGKFIRKIGYAVSATEIVLAVGEVIKIVS